MVLGRFYVNVLVCCAIQKIVHFQIDLQMCCLCSHKEAFDRNFLRRAKYNITTILLDKQEAFYDALVPSLPSLFLGTNHK